MRDHRAPPTGPYRPTSQLLSGPLAGIYGPNGLGAMLFAVLFAVLAVAAQLDRDYPRQDRRRPAAAAARGNHGGRPRVIDDDMLTFALALRDKGVPIPAIAAKLAITTRGSCRYLAARRSCGAT
ncbi:hypothetical protein ETD86_31900 [Nonomuraea turkmeniaca]|uniref:Resolvase HTH domain-containing protein n=1 Tax=Nonomuraea turkmeniaca TaxID=103838 RepID=A0A5S4F8H6_9ACTN|nr:hypothetical protein [Nonomuraea turkmeniaca]TMR12790.1 hypothetical protein ETD86_31900 [Nonomuraea turkmeniaca]